MTRRRKRGRYQAFGAPRQRSFDQAFREADQIAKGVEAERQALARARELSAEAELQRRRSLVLQAWQPVESELFPVPKQANLALRMALRDFLVWIVNSGDEGLVVSYATVAELKGYSRATAIKVKKLLAEAKLVVVEEMKRRGSFDGTRRDRGPNLYRIDWEGVASRLAATPSPAAPRADAAGASDSSDEAPRVDPAGEVPAAPCASPEVAQTTESEGWSRANTRWYPADTTWHLQGATRCASQGATRCDLPAAQASTREQGDSLPPPSPRSAASSGAESVRADARAEEVDCCATWEDAERLLRGTGLSEPVARRALRRARRDGYGLAEISRLVAVWREFRSRFDGPGAVVWRLKSRPGLSELEGWPLREPLVRSLPGRRPSLRADVGAYDAKLLAIVSAMRRREPALTPSQATERAEALIREKDPDLYAMKET